MPNRSFRLWILFESILHNAHTNYTHAHCDKQRSCLQCNIRDDFVSVPLKAASSAVRHGLNRVVDGTRSLYIELWARSMLRTELRRAYAGISLQIDNKIHLRSRIFRIIHASGELTVQGKYKRERVERRL